MPYRVTRYRLLMVKDGSITTTWDRQVRQPRDVADFMAPLAANLDREHFWLLALDGKNRLMGLHVVSVGSLTAALVHRVLAMNAEGTERLVAEIPFRLLGHWISAAVTRRLRTARPLPPTDEVLRRQTALEAALKEYPARRAEALRQRGMLPPADFVVGDLTKGGRDATPAELEVLSGRQADGVPNGLSLCADCGFWKGQCLDPNAEFRGKVMRVHCGCDNWNRCAACGETLYHLRLNANYYDQREGAVVHVPGFSGLIHECAGTSRHDG